jgi:hypothetical protein
LESALEAEGLEVWLDESEIRAGAPLSGELQSSIRDSRALVLLWSRAASSSRWVNSEWLMALHQDVLVLPCPVDPTPLPQCLRNNVFLRMDRRNPRVVSRLARRLRDAHAGPTPVAPVGRGESAELRDAIKAIRDGQQDVLDRLNRWEVAEAAAMQKRVDDLMDRAQRAWPLDPRVVTASGYHLKNAYMIRHWDAVQAWRAEPDELLGEAEGRFFETLFLDPFDPSSLNGLGNIFFFERDLDAAEFFSLAAIKTARRRGDSYPDAEADLATIRQFKAA